MKHTAVIKIAAILGIAFLAGACGSRAASAPAADEPADVLVLYTNDIWGETEPCG